MKVSWKQTIPERFTPGTRLNRLKQLRAADYVQTCRAAACIIRIAFVLREKPLPQLLQQFGLSEPLPLAASLQVATAVQRVRWAHFLVPIAKNCLLDSLAAALLLRRDGYSVPLAIGVCRQGEQFLAHAWLGEEAEAPQPYRVLWRSPAVPL